MPVSEAGDRGLLVYWPCACLVYGGDGAHLQSGSSGREIKAQDVSGCILYVRMHSTSVAVSPALLPSHTTSQKYYKTPIVFSDILEIKLNVCVFVCHGARMEVRRQLMEGVSSLLPQCGSHPGCELKSGLAAVPWSHFASSCELLTFSFSLSLN